MKPPKSSFAIGLILIAIGSAPIQSLAQEQRAMDTLQAPESWKWVPSDTDFYWGLHHLDMQIEQLLQSNVGQRMAETTFWKKSNDLFQKEWKDRKSDLATWKARLDNPAAREIRSFLYDIASHDLFLYADGNLSRTIEQWNSIVPALERLLNGATRAEDKADIVARWVDEVLPNLQFPTLLVAGRYSDNERALARIDELEGAIRLGISFIPDLGPVFKSLKRIEDRRGNRLEWQINSQIIPWDQIPETDALDRETIQDLKTVSKNKSITFTIGTLDNYFCVAISGDNQWITKFGSDTNFNDHPEIQALLADQVPEMPARPVESSAIVTSSYYSSDSFVAAAQKATLDGFFRKIARTILLPIIDQQPSESDTAAWLTSLLDDASWIDDRIGRHVVRYRGASKIAWISDQAFESVQVDRTPMQFMNSQQPLEGIRIAGSKPLLLLNMRLASHPEYFATAREIVRRAKSSLEELILIQDAPADLGPFRLAHEQLKSVWPGIVSVTEDWQRRILPNLNGEHMVVIQSGGLASKNWLKDLGESESPLPLPEIALASGIDRSDDFSTGAVSIANAIGRMLSSYGIKPPKTKLGNPTDDWSIATLPETEGDPEVGKLQGILATSPRWNWLGYSMQQWESFARESKSPKGDVSKLIPFADADGPLASAALIDLGESSNLANQWLRFVLAKADVDSNGNLMIPPTSTGRKLTVTAAEVIEFFDCLNELGKLTSYSKAIEGGATLSRSRYQ